MNFIPLLALLLASSGAQPPFTLEAKEDVSARFPQAPHIQSFCFAQWESRWVFIGGRIAGYHALGGGSADFSPADANREVWVIDTTLTPARTFHAPLTSLPAKLQSVKDEWGTTGQLCYQDGSSLYVAGGYGQDSSGHWVTSQVISKVSLPQFIDGVEKGTIPEESIRFTESPIVQSAGGELVKLGDGCFYLVMGHVFTGSYTAFEGQGENNREQVSQTYLNEIRKLEISDNSNRGLLVKLVTRYRDETEFHRRDLNVTKIMSPKGVGLAAYGGVFTPDTQLSYSKPVYLFPGSDPVVDAAFDQKMNAYNSAKLLLYDSSRKAMFTVLFGGISRFFWNSASNCFTENARTGSKTQGNYMDGLQWSDQISVIQRLFTAGKEVTSESVQPETLPGFIGTDAVFIPLPGLFRASSGTDILDLEPLRGKRTLLGYLYGGIRAYPFRFPYDKTAEPYNSGTVPTKPSDLILSVYLTVAQ
jgi:hypothetical protein